MPIPKIDIFLRSPGSNCFVYITMGWKSVLKITSCYVSKFPRHVI